MKKCFQLMGFALMIPAVIGAENSDLGSAEGKSPITLAVVTPSSDVMTRSEGEDASVLPVVIAGSEALRVSPLSLPREVPVPLPTRDLPVSLSSAGALSDLKSDPRNFEAKGGVAGFLSESVLSEAAILEKLRVVTGHYNDLKEYNNTLLAQLGIANESLKGMQALHRALETAQKERDEEARARVLLESRLKAVEARATFLKSNEEKLLLEADRKDAAMVLEKARKEFLERENLSLREIIAELAANAKKVESLFAENNDYERMLQTSGGESIDIEATRQSIRLVVDENAKKIRELQEKNKALAQQEKETRAKISKLEKAIEANDHYTLVLNKINDRCISDEDLALYIWSIRTVLGVDLDQLSEGHDKRLIEVLIDVSRPYEDRPSYGATCTYSGCFRTLGNQFTPYGLGWAGPPLNFKECTYARSKFAQTSTDVARYAKGQLNRK